MSALTITPIIAPQTLECWRCNADSRVGLIFAGEQCVEIAQGDKIEFACEECYERLWDEIMDLAK